MVKKEFEANDPMELVGVALPQGDLEQMAECLVEEYIRTGWDEECLLGLFRNPFYLATHRIYKEKGEKYLRRLIATVRQNWGYGESEDIFCLPDQEVLEKRSLEEVKSDGKLA